MSPLFEFAIGFVQGGESLKVAYEYQTGTSDLDSLRLTLNGEPIEKISGWSYEVYDYLIRQDDVRFLTNFDPCGAVPLTDLWRYFMERHHTHLEWGNYGVKCDPIIREFVTPLVEEISKKKTRHLAIPSNAPFVQIPVDQLTPEDESAFFRVRNP
jgi:hypothetical protein